ncbi:MAG TPA: hypothetical protein VND95_11075 [Stellaceae bacterium]|nr:hypothetical protein [Stellaceae bacterium]
MRRGIYRILGVGGQPNDVRVEDDGIDLPLEEARYIAQGYLPPVDHLPWKEEYLAQKARQDAQAAANEIANETPRGRSNLRDGAAGWRRPGQR